MKKTPFYYVTKVCFASKKPWVKNFVNLPSAYFSAFSLQPIFMAIMNLLVIDCRGKLKNHRFWCFSVRNPRKETKFAKLNFSLHF